MDLRRFLRALRIALPVLAAVLLLAPVSASAAAPVACFSQEPSPLFTGQTATFDSGCSTDRDNDIVSRAWDLDDDGSFDDGTGVTATSSWPAPGSYTVHLRVVDRKRSATVAHTVVVRERTPAPAPAPLPEGAQPLDVPAPVGAAARLRPLRPFPTVRMRGRTTRRGARLSKLAVRAPHGALVQVRCKGRRCPSKLQSLTVRTRSARGAKTVRFKRFERFLPGGVVLQISVTRPGTVGKFTRIRIRRLALPVRTDHCLVPGSFKPVGCARAR